MWVLCLSSYICRISICARNDQHLTISKTLNINRNRLRRIFQITIFIFIIFIVVIIRHTFRISAVLTRRCLGVSSWRNLENVSIVCSNGTTEAEVSTMWTPHSNRKNTSGQCSRVSRENIQSSVRRIHLNANGIHNGCILFQFQLNWRRSIHRRFLQPDDGQTTIKYLVCDVLFNNSVKNYALLTKFNYGFEFIAPYTFSAICLYILARKIGQ